MQAEPKPDPGIAGSEAPTMGAGSVLLPAAGDPPALRFMKIVVIVLGIALVLGFFTIIGRMIYLTSGRDASVAPVTRGGTVREVAVPVSPGAEVRHLAFDGNRIAVHLTGPAGGPGTILVVDIATGRVASRIELLPEGSPAPGNGGGR